MHARVTWPFVLSVLVHAALAVLMIGWMLRPVDQPFVIDMPPWQQLENSPALASAEPRVSSAPASVNFVPRPAPARPVESRVQPSTSLPASPRQVAPVNSPPPDARPARPVASTVTTLEEHRRRYPQAAPANATAASSSAAPTGAPRRINVDEIVNASRGEGSQTEAIPTGDDEARRTAFFGHLLSLLRAAHEKPAGLGDALQAQVEFTLSETGEIAGVRIVRSSGNGEFDASVLAAFRRLRDVGAVPPGAAGVNKVTFRVQGD